MTAAHRSILGDMIRPSIALCLASSMILLAACGDDSSSGGGGSGAGATSANGTPTSATGSSTQHGSTGATNSTGATPTSSSSGTPIGSAGCGMAVSDTQGDWNAKTIDVEGTTRDYFVFVPPGYDPMRAYPVVYQFHGCSDSADKENNNVPIQNESQGDAIIVRGRAVGNCWDTTGEGPDVKLFDAMVASIEAGYCADSEKRFVAGYSSGSFMTHLLGCSRGGMLAGVASIAGGQTGQNCTGPVAALLIHDSDDPTVNISQSIGARDQYLAANHCAATTQPFDPDPCQQYDGCDAGLPVVWCQTAGHGHDRQDALAAPAFWNFLSAL